MNAKTQAALARLNATADAICAANPMSPLARLRAATLAARRRTGNDAIGTAVEQGAFKVVNVAYSGRRSTVDVLSSGHDIESAIAFLESLT